MDIDWLKSGTTTVIVAAAACLPSAATAGEWVPEATTIVDSTGITGGRPALEFTIATQGFATPTKLNGLAYVDTHTQSVRYAQREAPVGSTLVNEPWTIEEVTFPFNVPPAEFNWPALTMDPVTGRPYVAYTLGDNLWVSTRVGAGMGNCGTASAWLCESISTVCEMPITSPLETPQVELGGTFGMEADTLHIVDVESDMLDIRKDLETGQWSCTSLTSSSGYRWSFMQDSTTIRYEYDDRVKPLLAYAVDFEHRGQYALFIRALVDSVGAPVPAPLWAEESLAGSAHGSWTPVMPSVTLLDGGLSQPVPEITGFGNPAIVSLRTDHYDAPDPADIISCGGMKDEPGLPWDLLYQEADSHGPVAWPYYEEAYIGEPCWPSMDAGWDGNPYLAFVEQTTGDIMVTTRRDGPGWHPAQKVASFASMPSLAYDYDDGSIAIAYQDKSEFDVVIADGWWSEWGEPVEGP